jgi:hypothetical protein
MGIKNQNGDAVAAGSKRYVGPSYLRVGNTSGEVEPRVSYVTQRFGRDNRNRKWTIN